MENGNTNTKKSSKRNAVALALINENQEIQDAIRFKAHELYLERNCADGNDIEDWIEAERIVLQRLS